MRIGIMGAGGIGSVVGGKLSVAGHDVTLIDQWAEHIDKINSDGLLVEHRDSKFVAHPNAVHLNELESIVEPFDAVFISVKAYDTEQATEMMLPYVDPDNGVFVNFQNGLNDIRMANIAE